MEGYNSDIRKLYHLFRGVCKLEIMKARNKPIIFHFFAFSSEDKLYPESRLRATWLLWTCARRDAVRGPKMLRVARCPARHIVAHEVDHRPPSRGSMHGDAVEFLFASFGAQPRAGARALETG
jgi:hypothetical protein